MLLWPNHPAFNTLLSEFKGVGPKTCAQLKSEDFYTSGDLLALSPKYYQDRRQSFLISQLEDGQEALIDVCVISARGRWSPKSRRRFMEAVVEDEENIRLTLLWFNCASWMEKSLYKGLKLQIFGCIRKAEKRFEMAHPDLIFTDEAGLHPIYPPIGGLSSAKIKKFMPQALELLSQSPKLFSEKLLKEKKLIDPSEALAIIHQPPSDFSGMPPLPTQSRAFRQLAFYELFFWRLLMLKAREAASGKIVRHGLLEAKNAVQAYWEALPFKLSSEQKRVTKELLADLCGKRPMARLLQGEVGGGKTAVAGGAVFFALGRGGQAAIMSPTEVLARQHYDFFKKIAEELGFKAVLLTGSLSEKEKRNAREELADGRAQLAIGSQALISKTTVFQNLTLAIIDEQHRFGVRQRLALRQKNQDVDLLVMSATPIPRSLSLMLYGDLDSSRLNGLLPGRIPAETILFKCGERKEAYLKLFKLLEKTGGQAFVVSPRIEADSLDEINLGLPSLEDIKDELQSLLKGPEGALNCLNVLDSQASRPRSEFIAPSPYKYKIDCLHGQQDASVKEKAMENFRLGKTKILLATSIIEVGVDVPAAKLILILGAERFGLAQLHQLRGRVGRAGTDAYCLLLPQKLNPNGELRLNTLLKENNGQKLAELDLEMRGPGEQLGLRQSGWPKMTYARLPQDLPLLAKAHALAEELWQNKDTEEEFFWQKIDFSALENKMMEELD